MKRFVVKLIIFTLPFWVVVASYFIYDPFKVLYRYNDFYRDYNVNLNRDYVSTQLFIQQNKKYHYNAFIFGSSRTMAYRTKDWRVHLDNTARPFVFDASMETIYGIWSKIKFLDRENVDVNDVLFVFCTDVTFNRAKDPDGHLYVKHPEVDERQHYMGFQHTFFSTYFKDGFFIRYLDYKWGRKNVKYLNKGTKLVQLKADTVTNEQSMVNIEQELSTDSAKYYKEHDAVFFTRNKLTQSRHVQIDETNKALLKEIKEIFDKRHTRYEIVLSPLYDQVTFNKEDVKTLEIIFGKKHVHDYSGINGITDSKYNYFEQSHYRPHIGRMIMDNIYGGDQQ
ncbi:MAG TPA: hypothetical protein VK750_06690 [Cytophagaceae bacterium]|nr:hypothetical protein [Cytophagaceae bacterium]